MTLLCFAKRNYRIFSTPYADPTQGVRRPYAGGTQGVFSKVVPNATRKSRGQNRVFWL